MNIFWPKIQYKFLYYLEKYKFFHAFKISCSACLAYYIALLMNSKTPFWAAISAFAVTMPTIEALLQKGWMRSLGAITGSWLSLLFLPFIGNQKLIFLICFIILTIIGFYLAKKRCGYFWNYMLVHIVAFITIGFFHPQEVFILAENRSVTVTLGVFVSWLVQCLLFPISKSKNKYLAVKVEPVFPVNFLELYHAIKVSIAFLMVILTWRLLDVPGGALNMIITITTIMQPDLMATAKKGAHRFLGCLIGVMIGALVLFMGMTALIEIFLVLLIFGTITMMGYLYEWYYNYASLQVMLGLCVTILSALNPAQETIEAGIERILGIVLGLIISWSILQLFNLGEYFLKSQKIKINI